MTDAVTTAVGNSAGLAWRIGHRFGQIALDLLLPPQCLTCDAPVAATGGLCSACFQATTFVGDPCCDACAAPFKPGEVPPRGASRICRDCGLAPPGWDRARAALRYDGQSKRLLLPLKYGDRIDLAAPIAALMARAGAQLLAEADVLVPVPLHRGRLRRRRYNQAALLGRALARTAMRPFAVDALLRVRATAPLNDLPAASRVAAVAGAFAVRTARIPAISGRRVLLIDDVLTTGATCGGCAAALRAAGAAGVDVLVAARAGRAELA